MASVAKNLHEVVFRELHPASEDRCAAANGGEKRGLRGELRPLSLRCGFETPPRRDE